MDNEKVFFNMILGLKNAVQEIHYFLRTNPGMGSIQTLENIQTSLNLVDERLSRLVEEYGE